MSTAVAMTQSTRKSNVAIGERMLTYETLHVNVLNLIAISFFPRLERATNKQLRSASATRLPH